jgi:hypothetical protein
MDVPALHDNDLVVEDGRPGARLEEADPRDLLHLTSEYLDALMAVARHHRLELHLTGLWVENRSRAARCRVNNVLAARAAMDLSAEYRLHRPRPRVLNQPFERLDKAIKKSGNKNFGARLGPTKYVPLAPVEEDESTFLWEETSLWLRVMETGSRANEEADKDNVWFKDDLDDNVFVVKASMDDVRRLGSLIKMYVRAELTVLRDTEGLIARGHLVRFDAPSSGDNLDEYATWQSWLRSSVDPEATLARLRKGAEE